MVAELGSCPRYTQTYQLWKLKWDNCKLSWCRHRQSYSIAIEQIRILTLQVNSNASVTAAAATTTAPTTTTAGPHSQTPKANHQFGKDIIPNIPDGKQRNDFREWAENSALYLSAQCVDACEILLEWLVMEKEHVTEAAIQTKCEEEDWEYDSISTFCRVIFVYL